MKTLSLLWRGGAELMMMPLIAPSAACAFSIGITGDVNLNPSLKASTTPPEFVWGDLLNVTRAVDVMAIQHEGTVAEIPDPNPATIQFEDPLNYTATYRAAGIDFITIANNHQMDFGWAGVDSTHKILTKTGIPFGGIGRTEESVRRPTLVTSSGPTTAFFTVVVDECWRWPNGTLYLDGCTCGPSANPSHKPPYQCYSAAPQLGSTVPYGMWYRFNITDDFIEDVASTVKAYKDAHPTTLVVCYLHVGPNFQWTPYPQREHLLRNISLGADLVWGTSSHHIQRFEVFRSTPIVYGLGDFLFRHIVGVEDWCPVYARPCSDYRPDLSLMYVFDIHVSPVSGRPSVNLQNITAFGTRHDRNRTMRVSDPDDVSWIVSAFRKQAVGAQLVPVSSERGRFRVLVDEGAAVKAA